MGHADKKTARLRERAGIAIWGEAINTLYPQREIHHQQDVLQDKDGAHCSK